jgi:hypothetical protein
MKLHEQRTFLQDVLEGEDMQSLRQDSLQKGLTALRRKRRWRFLGRSAFLACIPLLFCVLWLANRLHPRHPLAPEISSAAHPITIKVINDKELFALFPNRPIALVGKPGHQQLLFLDQLQN